MVKASLIDLSFLTEEERKRITEVLNRDAKIQQKEEARIRHLQNKAARTKNETIKKKIKMRSGEWFWELAGKQGGLKRSDTATASVRASLRIRQKETKKANKPTSSLTEVGGDISSDYNKTESRKNGFSVDVHQTNIATQDNRLGEADVSNTTESPEREQSSSTSRSSEKVTRQEAVDDRAILPSSEEHDESNEDSSYFVANHPYADSENTHQSFPLELSKGDGDGEMWNNSLSAERGIPSIVVKGPSVTDDVSERSSDRSSSRDYSSDSEHSYSSSDDKSSSGEDAPRTIAKEYYIDNVTTATKNDENKHEATSQEIITHHSSSADQKESEELFKPMPRAEAVAVVVANTITERTEDVSVHELSENDTASVKSEKYHSEEDEKSRRSSSSSSSSESRKSDAGDNVAEDILEGSETHVLSRVSPSSVEVQDEGEASPIPVVETNQASTRIPSISVDETDKRESTPPCQRKSKRKIGSKRGRFHSPSRFNSAKEEEDAKDSHPEEDDTKGSHPEEVLDADVNEVSPFRRSFRRKNTRSRSPCVSRRKGGMQREHPDVGTS